MKINLYDFDNTIYKGDSSTDFFFYALCRYPKILKVIPGIVIKAIKYKLGICTKTQMKEKIFSFVKYVPDIDSLVKEFWSSHEIYIKDFYLEKGHDSDIIISASPEFLLNPIIKKLKPLDFMGTIVNKKTGKFTGINCHGEEKVRRLNEKYSDYKVMESYSDSRSDIPILRLAKKQFLVKGDKLIPANFK